MVGRSLWWKIFVNEVDRVIRMSCYVVGDENALWNHGRTRGDFLHAASFVKEGKKHTKAHWDIRTVTYGICSSNLRIDNTTIVYFFVDFWCAISVNAKFHYASWFGVGSELVRSQIPLRYLVRTSFEPASSYLRTSSEPALNQLA